MSKLLENLYIKYEISQLPNGKVGDALGDVYEEFILEIFKDLATMRKWPEDSLERLIVKGLFDYFPEYERNIESISSSKKDIPKTKNGGSPKTDVYLVVNLINSPSPIIIPLNIKQSTVPRVSFAEYDADTISEALGITDPKLISLLIKHQCDASAKNFTDNDLGYLRTHLAPYTRNLVRWCITLSPIPTSQDVRHPEYVIRFDLHHPLKNPQNGNQYKNFNIYSIDEYINKIMFTNKMKPRKGGFGTGLSWTYATGSKGLKIQFKA